MFDGVLNTPLELLVFLRRRNATEKNVRNVNVNESGNHQHFNKTYFLIHKIYLFLNYSSWL